MERLFAKIVALYKIYFGGKKKFMTNKVGRPQKNKKNIYGFLIPKAPVCICGSREYFYTILTNDGDKIRARCKKCRYDRYYNSISEIWGPL
jgi:hypothetical protein